MDSKKGYVRMDRWQVRKEIERRGSGRVLLYLHRYAKETEKKYGARLDEVKRQYPDHILGADYTAGREGFEDQAYWFGGLDEFGCEWEVAPGGVSAQIKHHPLEDWDGLQNYIDNHLPSLSRDTRNRFEQAEALRKANPETYILGHNRRTFFERVHCLRGMDRVFVDLYENRDRVFMLLEALAELNTELIRGWSEVGVDAVFLGDDWGSQKSLMIDPEMWRDLFKPWYVKLIRAAHEAGLQFWFHSCGNVTSIIGDLIECGVDVLHPVQPEAMDLKNLSESFRGKLTFCGGISTQATLPFGTLEAVKEEAKSLVSLFNTENGGYIGCPSNTIMPETPIENIVALCSALRQKRIIV
jgi:uroporphyrinogen decarboxylase